MSSIFFIRDALESTNIKIKIWRIRVIRILFGKFSLYIISPRTFTILKNFNLVKFNLSLGLMV